MKVNGSTSRETGEGYRYTRMVVGMKAIGTKDRGMASGGRLMLREMCILVAISVEHNMDMEH